MAVKIRLSRIGRKHVPFFRIVAVDGRKPRDGAFLENLGTYDALNSKLIHFHEERLNAWMAKGAIPTDAVKKLQRLHKKSAEEVASKVAIEPKKKVAAKKTTKKTTASAA